MKNPKNQIISKEIQYLFAINNKKAVNAQMILLLLQVVILPKLNFHIKIVNALGIKEKINVVEFKFQKVQEISYRTPIMKQKT
jgi:hypothetical protein